MIPASVYHVLHLVGIILVFSAYGALISRAILSETDVRLRKFGGVFSGIGFILILVSGFGLQAVLKIGWPGWLLVKLAVWLALAAMIMAINRKRELSIPLYWLTVALGLLAVSMVYLRPF